MSAKDSAPHAASALPYGPRLAETLARRRQLFEDRRPDRILAALYVDQPNPALEAFRRAHAEGACGYPDPRERLAYWEWFLRDRMAVEDDSVPSAYLNEWDMGLPGALLGGRMVFCCHAWGRYSSAVAPFLGDWSEFDRLRFDPQHPWFRQYVEQLRLFATGAAGKFGLAPPCLLNHLHLLFELFGATRTYLELTDHPARVRQAVELALELSRRIMDAFFANVPLLGGGTCQFNNQWVPGRIVMDSVDVFHMTSVACFEEWGRPALERLFAAYDGGVTHLHGNGRHLLKAVATVKGLKLVDLADDEPGVPSAWDVLNELRAQAGDMPLVVSASYEPFCEALRAKRLAGGVFYNVGGAPDADAANRCMERVRAYSR